MDWKRCLFHRLLAEDLSERWKATKSAHRLAVLKEFSGWTWRRGRDQKQIA